MVLVGETTVYTNLGIPINASVTLHCYALHNEIKWLRDNEVIVSNGELLDNVTDKFNFSCSSYQHQLSHGWCNLTILSAKIEDSGTYQCNSSYLGHIHYARVTALGRIRFKISN